MSCKTLGLVLAAGFSERFGPADKRAYRLNDGCTLLAHSVAIAAGCFDQWYVVIREEDELEALGLEQNTPVIRTCHASEGQARSLADGLEALLADSGATQADAVAIFLGDMPYLKRDTVARIGESAAADAIVRPTYRSRPGHPVLIGQRFWAILSKHRGVGVGSVKLKSLTPNYREIPVDDDGVCRDIDAPHTRCY